VIIPRKKVYKCKNNEKNNNKTTQKGLEFSSTAKILDKQNISSAWHDYSKKLNALHINQN